MASTGAENGTIIAVYIGSAKIGRCISHSFGLSVNPIDVTTKDSAGWEENIGGVRGAKIDFDALFAEEETEGFSAMFALVGSRAHVTLKWSTEVSGDKKYTASALITSLDISAPMEDKVTYKGSFKISGPVTEAAIT